MRVRKRRSRAARYPRHGPYVLAWMLGLLVSAWLLVGPAYAIGRRRPSDPTAIPEAVLAAASSPGTAITMAFGARSCSPAGAFACRKRSSDRNPVTTALLEEMLPRRDRASR